MRSRFLRTDEYGQRALSFRPERLYLRVILSCLCVWGCFFGGLYIKYGDWNFGYVELLVVFVLGSLAFSWFIRKCAIIGSTRFVGRLEATYRSGRFREAVELLRNGAQYIHPQVIRSAEFQQLIENMMSACIDDVSLGFIRKFSINCGFWGNGIKLQKANRAARLIIALWVGVSILFVLFKILTAQ